MTPHRRPGFPDEASFEGFWPLVVVSGILHIAIFLGFGQLAFVPAKRTLPSAFTMVDLRGSGQGQEARGTPSAQPQVGPPPPRAKTTQMAKAKAEPVKPQEKPRSPPEPSQAIPPPRLAPPKTPPRTEPAPTPKPTRPAPDVKTIPKTEPSVPDHPPPVPPKPKESESSEDPVAERIARLKEKRSLTPDDPVADRIARIREKRGTTNEEANVADRIARLRERQIQGSESQVSRRIEALREKYGTREPVKEPGRSGAGGGGPLAVQGSGAQGAAGLAESQYLMNLKNHLDLHWSVPEALKGRGYRAAVTVIVDRRGVIMEWALLRSGNRFFDERVERAVAEANPLPPVPNALSGQRFEYELRFSAP